jgi:hypothetical protein
MPFSALEDKKQELIRKAKDGSVFVAPIEAALIVTLTTGVSADLTPLPTTGGNYVDLGHTTTDGVTYGRTTDLSEVRSFGSVEPTRTDVTNDTITMACTGQETKLQSIGLYTGADYTTITAAATTGEVQVAKPDRPSFRYYRVFGLFVDDGDAGEIYFARFMPRARVTEIGEQQYTDGDEAIGYPLTFTGYKDSVAGYSHKWYWGGPGWLALLDEMGITQDS